MLTNRKRKNQNDDEQNNENKQNDDHKQNDENNKINIKKQKINESENNKDITCVICLDKIKDKNNVKTNCEHNFCLTCLLEHLKYKNTCPCCRIPIENIRNDKKQLTLREMTNLIALNIEQNEIHLFNKAKNIKNFFISALLMDNNYSINTNNDNFEEKLNNIINSEIFNKRCLFYMMNELLSISAIITLQNIENTVEWFNQ